MTFSHQATLDLKTASVIATSLVQTKLDYCYSLYLNLPQKKEISRLQLLQNSLARAATATPETEYISPVLKCLHWINIEERIHYKLSLLLTTFSVLINHSNSDNLKILNLQTPLV